MELSIVVPVYNEVNTVNSVIEDLVRFLRAEMKDCDCEVLVINDGSTDGSFDRLKEHGEVRILRHRLNRGYGAAIKTGLRHAAGRVIITMDSDGQHTPSNIRDLFEAIGDSDMVIGCRPPGGGSPTWRLPGKWLLGRLVNYLSEARIPDFNSGFRAFKKETSARYVHLCPDGFSFSTTLTLAFLCQGRQVNFEPIDFRSRSAASTSEVRLTTGLSTLLLIIRLISLFGPLKLFLPISALFLLTGTCWGAIYIARGSGLSVGALLILSTGLLLFFFGLLMDQVAALRKERFE